MDYIRKNITKVLLLVLILTNVFIWLAVFESKPGKYAQVSFLDVGQGDAILITASNRNQILIDAGRDKKVLRELGKVMPFFDRSIDVLIETHPDADHIGGMPEVVKRYSVANFLEPGVESENSIDDELERRINIKGVESTLARSGQIINLGDGSFLRILFPDRDVSLLETNDASIVAQYFFGDTCFFLTGDSPIKIEEYLVNLYGESLKCDVLKAGHHGSRTSTGDTLLKALDPNIAIVSAGQDNTYGHPHAEVLERLKQADVEILSTIEHGTIHLVSDGKKIWKK